LMSGGFPQFERWRYICFMGEAFLVKAG
jgi:hypothetical protein